MEENMKRSFVWTLKNGQKAVLTAEYEEIMEREKWDADGYVVEGDLKPTATKSNLELTIDGKFIDRCYDASFWQLIDTPDKTAKKIRGMKVGFADAKTAAEYEKFIMEVISEGKSEEVKEYERQKELEWQAVKARVEEKEKRIKTLLKGKGLSEEEALRKMKEARKRYNDIHNEGGSGYIPNTYFDLELFLKTLKSQPH
jgi:hypothetical protein